MEKQEIVGNVTSKTQRDKEKIQRDQSAENFPIKTEERSEDLINQSHHPGFENKEAPFYYQPWMNPYFPNTNVLYFFGSSPSFLGQM